MNVAQKIKASLYDRDFAAWAEEQAAVLRLRDFARLDVVNLLDEIETLGRAQKRAIETRLAVLIAHLWKWQVQPELRSRSWILTIEEQRRAISELIGRNPSLAGLPTSVFGEAVDRARRLVERDTGLEGRNLPKRPPFDFEAVFDPHYPFGSDGEGAS